MFASLILVSVCRDGSVGIATRHGLDGPGLDFRWRRDFPRPFRPALGPAQPPVQWVPVLPSGSKAAGAWRWPPTQSSAEVKERAVPLLLPCPFVACSMINFTLYFVLIYRCYLVSVPNISFFEKERDEKVFDRSVRVNDGFCSSGYRPFRESRWNYYKLGQGMGLPRWWRHSTTCTIPMPYPLKMSP